MGRGSQRDPAPFGHDAGTHDRLVTLPRRRLELDLSTDPVLRPFADGYPRSGHIDKLAPRLLDLDTGQEQLCLPFRARETIIWGGYGVSGLLSV